MSGWENPAIAGLLIGIPSTIFGAWGLWRAFKNDKKTENAAVVAAQTGSVAQVIAGLNGLIDNLQEDNKVWRENFKELSLKLAEVVKERDLCRKEYNAIVRKYGITNGNSN